MNNKVILKDGVAAHAEEPDKFYIPHPVLIKKLRVGDLVKVCVEISTKETSYIGGEQIWVRLTVVRETDYQGVVESFPQSPIALGVWHGDTLTFESRHIIDIVPLEQQAVEAREYNSLLTSLDEVVKLPEDYANGVEIDAETLRRVAPLSIPEGLSLYVRGDDIPFLAIRRIGDSLEVEVNHSVDRENWDESCTADELCSAMVAALKDLSTNGHPISYPEIDEDEDLWVQWKMHFGIDTRFAIMIRTIEVTSDRAELMAFESVG